MLRTIVISVKDFLIVIREIPGISLGIYWEILYFDIFSLLVEFIRNSMILDFC